MNACRALAHHTHKIYIHFKPQWMWGLLWWICGRFFGHFQWTRHESQDNNAMIILSNPSIEMVWVYTSRRGRIRRWQGTPPMCETTWTAPPEKTTCQQRCLLKTRCENMGPNNDEDLAFLLWIGEQAYRSWKLGRQSMATSYYQVIPKWIRGWENDPNAKGLDTNLKS